MSTAAQLLEFSKDNLTAIRFDEGSNTAYSTRANLLYDVTTGDKELSGIGAAIYFNSEQIQVEISDIYQPSLLGYNLTEDTNNGDNNNLTDRIATFSYMEFSSLFPGSTAELPLKLASLLITPTENFTGTTINSKGEGSVGFDVIAENLQIQYNSAPSVVASIPDQSGIKNKLFSYELPVNSVFFDADSPLTYSIDNNLLPDGLTFNPQTASINGIPTQSGLYTIPIEAADELGSTSTDLTLEILESISLGTESETIQYKPNNTFTIPLDYFTSDGKSTSGGSFNVFFDPSLFSFKYAENWHGDASIKSATISEDIDDRDNDPSTKSVVNISVVSFTSSIDSNSRLVDLVFDSDLSGHPNGIDPITGEGLSKMNYTATELPPGYGFVPSSTELKPIMFSLDVDGDGRVTAFGDGLMIIRKLLGNAFSGDKLTDKALSPNATRTTEEIHSFIETGIDSLALDLDQDGRVTAFGDGLMLIRNLLGAAFTGEKLTDKALSPSSPYYGDPNAWQSVEENIENLIP